MIFERRARDGDARGVVASGCTRSACGVLTTAIRACLECGIDAIQLAEMTTELAEFRLRSKNGAI